MPPSLTGIKRDITEDIIKSLGTPHIKDIIGVRRCGKTTILHQLAEHLSNQGVWAKDIIFLNFDDPSININKKYDYITKPVSLFGFAFISIKFLILEGSTLATSFMVTPSTNLRFSIIS